MRSFFATRQLDRRRIVAFGFALLVELLFIAGLLLIGGYTLGPERRGTTTTLIDVAPAIESRASAAQSAERARTTPPPPPRERVEATTPPVPVPPTAPGFIVMTREDFAKSDIGKLPRRGANEGAQSAEAGDAGRGNGQAPGGGNLYNAEWVREPTDGELALYMPKTRGPGWAMIACRTVPRNRVEDCRPLGETPGSGLANRLRQAAWQFQVRPPRRDGEPIIGAWVRIRFDFTERRAEDDAARSR